MKHILFLSVLACLLVLPVSYSLACGSKKTGHKSEIKQTSHHQQNSRKKCCDLHAHEKSGNKSSACGHNCDPSCCDCGHVISVFALKVYPSEMLQKAEFTTLENRYWFFTERTPKPVYLSLFIPPNISGLLS